MSFPPQGTSPDQEHEAPAPVSPTTPVSPTAGDHPWQRVHIATPLVRGWIALVAIVFVVGREILEGFLGGRSSAELPEFAVTGWAAAAVAAAVLAIACGFAVSWYFTRYQLTQKDIRVSSGVLFRQHRQARLDRVEAIEVAQPLLARMFGLAELRFDVADAGESAVRLSFLKVDAARTLRAKILARAKGPGSGVEHPDTEQETPEHLVVVIPAGRVVGSALLSGSAITLLAGALVILLITVISDVRFLPPVLIPLVLGVIGAAWGTINTGMNFRLAVAADGIRVRYGFLDTRAQTVPPERIQAIGITQPPLWKIPGWYKVSVNVAGYGQDGSDTGAARSTLLPVGTQAEVLRVLALVLPDPGTADPLAVFTAGLDGQDQTNGFQTMPRRARLLTPLSWRRNGFAVTETALLMRSGALWRSLAVVPHARIQSLSLHQGPLDRRLRVGEMRFHTSPGPVNPRITHIDDAAAWELFHAQAARAADARQVSSPRTERR